jgi:hypothetical protein
MVLIVIGSPFSGPPAITVIAASPYGLVDDYGHSRTDGIWSSRTTHRRSDRPSKSSAASKAAPGIA